MKTAALIIGLAIATLFAPLSPGQDGDQPEKSEGFVGKIVFHQKYGPITYELNVVNGEVTGVQRMTATGKAITQVIGGRYDADRDTMTLLIRGGSEVEPRYRVQAQQFRIYPKVKEVMLEHMLADYGLTIDNAGVTTAHVLDTLESGTE